MFKKIFTSISEAEKFRLKMIQEGYKTTLTVAPNYVSVNFSKKALENA